MIFVAQPQIEDEPWLDAPVVLEISREHLPSHLANGVAGEKLASFRVSGKEVFQAARVTTQSGAAIEMDRPPGNVTDVAIGLDVGDLAAELEGMLAAQI